MMAHYEMYAQARDSTRESKASRNTAKPEKNEVSVRSEQSRKWERTNSASCTLFLTTSSSYHGEFRGAKRHVRGTRGNAANAFLQSQQAFVDFRTFGAQLPVVRQGVLPPFAARQVHEAQLAQ